MEELAKMEVSERFFKEVYANLLVNTRTEFSIDQLKGMLVSELISLLSKEFISLKVENGRLIDKEGM
jgi:hypothetical protein